VLGLWTRLVRPRNAVAILLVVAYVVYFIHLNLQSYYTYGEPPFDLAIFDQGMWLTTHFHVPFVTIMGRNLFGDHTSFVLLLFAPFYRLFPEPQGLLVLQTLLLAGPAVPIYILARKYIKSTVIATTLVAIYLLSPLIQQGNLDQFHPESFQVLIISLAIYAAIESKNGLLIVMVVLALMVKEDAAVLVVPLGLWVAARRDRRLGFFIIAGAIAWAMLANWLIIPTILGHSSFYGTYLPFGGVSGIISTLFHHPGQLFSYLGSQGRPFYLWQLAATVGFVFLFSPEIAAIGLLLVAENEISSFGYMHQILYQYTMTLAPILVLGALFAIAQQSALWRRNLLTVVALTGAIWTCTLWGFAPFSDNQVVTYTVAPTSIQGSELSREGVATERRGVGVVPAGVPHRRPRPDLCVADTLLRGKLGSRNRHRGATERRQPSAVPAATDSSGLGHRPERLQEDLARLSTRRQPRRIRALREGEARTRAMRRRRRQRR
jgi:uncharacterized membrane protein